MPTRGTARCRIGSRNRVTMPMVAKHDRAKNASPQIRPGDFPLGSAASRAAARSLWEMRQQSKQVIHLKIVLIGHPKDKPLPDGWRREWDGGVTECSYARE
jgi:hypothetical protein